MRFYALVAAAFVAGFFGTMWAGQIPVTLPVDLLPSPPGTIVVGKSSGGGGEPSPGQLLQAAVTAIDAFNQEPCEASRKAELIRTVSSVKRLHLEIDTCRDGGCSEATKKKAVALLLNIPLDNKMARGLFKAYGSGGITEADFAGVTGIQYPGQDQPAAILDCSPSASRPRQR